MALPLLGGLKALKALQALGPTVGPEAVKLAKKLAGSKNLRDAAHELAWQRDGLVGEVRFVDGAKRWVVVSKDHNPIAAFPPYRDGEQTQLREGLAGVDFSRCVGPSKQQLEAENRSNRSEQATRRSARRSSSAVRSSLSGVKNRRPNQSRKL